MFTPYDWQEGIGHRAQYCLSRLESGAPVLMVSLDEGILAFSVRRQSRKLYEVYNRLMFSAIGQQSDVESIRVAAIDFAHQEGYQRSENDVTIQRMVAYLSQPLKKAFADFQSAPFVARSLFAEVNKSPEEDTYYVLDYDGDFSIRKQFAYLTGDENAVDPIREGLKKIESTSKQSDALEQLKSIWAKAIDPSGAKSFAQLTENLEPEAALLTRKDGVRRFATISLS